MSHVKQNDFAAIFFVTFGLIHTCLSPGPYQEKWSNLLCRTFSVNSYAGLPKDFQIYIYSILKNKTAFEL
jgi:hypothetical protein